MTMMPREYCFATQQHHSGSHFAMAKRRSSFLGFIMQEGFVPTVQVYNFIVCKQDFFLLLLCLHHHRIKIWNIYTVDAQNEMV